MGTDIYNEINKVSRIVQLRDQSEKEELYEKVGTLIGIGMIVLSVSLMVL